MQPPSNKVHQLLDWYLSIGVDSFLSPVPIDRTKSLPDPINVTPTHAIQPLPLSGPISPSLEALRSAYENHEGCILKKTATTTVFGDGNPQSQIMFIGEAPGNEEDRCGIPFMGPSGELLNKMLASIGLDRTKVYITNLIPWRPPGNRPPTTAEIEACLPLLMQHIGLINPKVIVFLGGGAAKALLKTEESITKIRGKWSQWACPSSAQSIETLPMFHPAFLLRTPTQKKRAWQDLLSLKAKLTTMGILHA